MKPKYGVYGLRFGLVLAALVVIGLFLIVLGTLAEAYPLPPPGETPPDSGTEWNAPSIAGAVLGVAGLTHVVVLPVSMAADTKFVRRTTHWRPVRVLWVPLSLVPLLQLPVTVVYLLRRTYLLTFRPLLTSQQPDAHDGVMTATDTQQSVTDETVSEHAERSPPSLSRRVVSSLRGGLKTASYVLLSYFLAFGLAFVIGNLLGLEDTPMGLLLVVLWPSSYWVLR